MGLSLERPIYSLSTKISPLACTRMEHRCNCSKIGLERVVGSKRLNARLPNWMNPMIIHPAPNRSNIPASIAGW